MSKQTEAMKLALEFVEYHSKYWNGMGQHPQEIATALREALVEQPAQQCVCGEPKTSGTHRIDGPCYAEHPAQQEPKQSEIFCGVDIADGMLSVSVLRRRTDNVAELIHCEQIQLPAQQEPVVITEQMAFAFHNAITDGALGTDDMMDIMRGLEAAFAHVITKGNT